MGKEAWFRKRDLAAEDKARPLEAGRNASRKGREGRNGPRNLGVFGACCVRQVTRGQDAQSPIQQYEFAATVGLVDEDERAIVQLLE